MPIGHWRGGSIGDREGRRERKRRSGKEAARQGRRIDLLETSRMVQQHLTESLCREVFSCTCVRERDRLWSLYALANFWTQIVVRAPGSLTQAFQLREAVRAIRGFDYSPSGGDVRGGICPVEKGLSRGLDCGWLASGRDRPPAEDPLGRPLADLAGVPDRVLRFLPGISSNPGLRFGRGAGRSRNGSRSGGAGPSASGSCAENGRSPLRERPAVRGPGRARDLGSFFAALRVD